MEDSKNMKVNKVALIVAIAALACGALAQGGGGGGRQRGGRGGPQYGPMSLVNREEVQKEIGITDDQKSKLADLRTSTTAKMGEVRTSANGDRQAMQEGMAKVNADALKSLGDILKPEQMKRLRELEIQWTGKSIVVTDKQVQTDLGITDDQKTKLTELRAKEQAANQEAAQGGDRQAAMEARQKNAKIMEDEIDKVLTDAQKAKLADMGGKPMAKPAPPQRGGGGGGF
jgi:hypothetical protein